MSHAAKPLTSPVRATERSRPQSRTDATVNKLSLLPTSHQVLRGGICSEGNTCWLLSANSLQVADLLTQRALAEYRQENGKLYTCSEIQCGYFAITVEGSSLLSIVDPARGLRVVKRLLLSYEPTVVQPLDPTLYNNLTNKDTNTTSAVADAGEVLADEFESSPINDEPRHDDIQQASHPVAIGYKNGQVDLIDLVLEDPYYDDNGANHTSTFKFLKTIEEGELSNGREVTALCVLAEINSLAVGYANGVSAFWSLTTLNLMPQSVTRTPTEKAITHFCFQEVVQYTEGYIWISQATDLTNSVLYKCHGIQSSSNDAKMPNEDVRLDRVYEYILEDPDHPHKAVKSTLVLSAVMPEKDDTKHEDENTSGDHASKSPSSASSPTHNVSHSKVCFVWETLDSNSRRNRFMQVFNLNLMDNKSKSSKKAFQSYSLRDLNSSDPLLSMWVDVHSLQRFNNDMSFKLKALTPHSVYNISIVSATTHVLEQLSYEGVKIFNNPELLSKIHDQCVTLKMIERSSSKDHDDHMMNDRMDESLYRQKQLQREHLKKLKDVWNVCLTFNCMSPVIEYITSKSPQDEYLLSAPTDMVEWVREENNAIQDKTRDLMLEVLRQQGHRPRYISHQDRDYKTTELHFASHQLSELTRVIRTLMVRHFQYDTSGFESSKLSRLESRIKQIRDHVLILEWFLQMGFIPVASKLYNYETFSALWKQRREDRKKLIDDLNGSDSHSIEQFELQVINTLSQLKFVDQDMNPILDSESPTAPFFIDLIMKHADPANHTLEDSQQHFNYPPSDLNTLFDLFLTGPSSLSSTNNNTEEEEEEETMYDEMYKHAATLYFITDFSMSPHEHANTSHTNMMVTSYCRTFNISREWQQLIMGLWQLDCSTPDQDSLDLVMYLNPTHAPHHAFKHHVTNVLLLRGDFLAARRLYMTPIDHTVLYMRVLLCNHLLLSAFDLSRRCLNLNDRRCLFYCMMSYAHHTGTFAHDWISLPFDQQEEQWLVSFLKFKISNKGNGGAGDGLELDWLFGYYVSRHDYANAIRTYQTYQRDDDNASLRRFMCEQLIKALPLYDLQQQGGEVNQQVLSRDKILVSLPPVVRLKKRNKNQIKVDLMSEDEEEEEQVNTQSKQKQIKLTNRREQDDRYKDQLQHGNGFQRETFGGKTVRVPLYGHKGPPLNHVSSDEDNGDMDDDEEQEEEEDDDDVQLVEDDDDEESPPPHQPLRQPNKVVRYDEEDEDGEQVDFDDEIDDFND